MHEQPTRYMLPAFFSQLKKKIYQKKKKGILIQQKAAEHLPCHEITDPELKYAFLSCIHLKDGKIKALSRYQMAFLKTKCQDHIA